MDAPLGIFDEDGAEITSAAVRFRPDLEPPEKGAGRSTAPKMGINQRGALDCLHALWTKQAAFNRVAGIDAEPKISIAEWKNAMADAGLDRRRRSDVIRSLEKSGFVILDTESVILVDTPDIAENMMTELSG